MIRISRVNSKIVRERLNELLDANYSQQDIIIYLQEEFNMTRNAVKCMFHRIAEKDKSFAEKMEIIKKPKIKTKKQEVTTTLSIPIIEKQPIIEINPVVEDFKQILNIYADRLHKPIPDEIEALQEQYIILINRGLDAVFWMTGCIKEVAKKHISKHNIPYLISLLRHRMTKGWGVSNNEEEEIIIKEIEKTVGCELTVDQRGAIYRLMGQYGGVKVGLTLSKININELFINDLVQRLKVYDNEYSIRKQIGEIRELG